MFDVFYWLTVVAMLILFLGFFIAVGGIVVGAIIALWDSIRGGTGDA